MFANAFKPFYMNKVRNQCAIKAHRDEARRSLCYRPGIGVRTWLKRFQINIWLPVYYDNCSSKETKKKLEKNSDVVPNHLQRLEAKPVMSREEAVRNNI